MSTKISDAAVCKALTPDQPGQDRPAMVDIKSTLTEFRALPPEDQDDLREAYRAVEAKAK